MSGCRAIEVGYVSVVEGMWVIGAGGTVGGVARRQTRVLLITAGEPGYCGVGLVFLFGGGDRAAHEAATVDVLSVRGGFGSIGTAYCEAGQGPPGDGTTSHVESTRDLVGRDLDAGGFALGVNVDLSASKAVSAFGRAAVKMSSIPQPLRGSSDRFSDEAGAPSDVCSVGARGTDDVGTAFGYDGCGHGYSTLEPAFCCVVEDDGSRGCGRGGAARIGSSACGGFLARFSDDSVGAPWCGGDFVSQVQPSVCGVTDVQAHLQASSALPLSRMWRPLTDYFCNVDDGGGVLCAGDQTTRSLLHSGSKDVRCDVWDFSPPCSAPLSCPCVMA